MTNIRVPIELLERVCALWPEDMGDDGTNRSGWLPHVKQTVADLRALVTELNIQSADAQAVIDQYKQDAERYRWLRTQHIPLERHDFLSTMEVLDHRVDAAMIGERDD